MSEDQTIIQRPVKDSTPSKDRSAFLIVLSGASVGRMFKLDGDRHVLGRATDAEIRLDDDGVSRNHARMERIEDGTVVLEDLESTNGTYVNGQKITRKQLGDGDRIQIGSVTILKFSYQDSLEEQFQQQLYESATRDPLTKAFNKRFFTDQVEMDYTHAVRHSLPLSLLILDVDFFKQVNDTHGHAAGDSVLRILGSTIKTSIRNEDVCCRIGGEEFAVIMRDCNKADALVLAERLRELVERTPVPFEGKKLDVTISIGVATLDIDRHDNADQLTAEADKYLYEAKRGGRNRVCAAE